MGFRDDVRVLTFIIPFAVEMDRDIREEVVAGGEDATSEVANVLGIS